MSPNEIMILAGIGAALLVAIGIWFALRRKHSETLREHYGEEYDRTLETHHSRSDAEADLEARVKRVHELEIRGLFPGERDRYLREWNELKGVFVDSPAEAVLHADRLVTEVMVTRGYPMGDFQRHYEDLTVDHGDVACHYRDAHAICEKQTSGSATTEELRQALRHYEALVTVLIREGEQRRGEEEGQVPVSRGSTPERPLAV